MDSITDCEDSRFLFNNIVSRDKEIKFLNGSLPQTFRRVNKR